MWYTASQLHIPYHKIPQFFIINRCILKTKQGPSDATFTVARFGKKHADMQLRHAPCSYTNQISIPFQSATYTNPIRNRAGGIPRNWPGSTKAASGSSGAGRSHPVTSDGLRYCAAGGFRGRATGPSRWRTGAEDKKGTAAAVAKP
jgi:hypothetical protein